MLCLAFEDELAEDEPDVVFIVEEADDNELLPLVVAGK
jgi:hypothetical protein